MATAATKERGQQTEEAPKGTSQELERAYKNVELGQPAYTAYSPEVIDLIKRTLMPEGSTTADLYMMLELSARYKLDPFRREIWMIPGGNENGAAKRPLIIVGRDGLIRTASRSEDYEGFDSDVVREHDTFKVSRDAEGYVKIEHSYEGTQETRGDIKGAWAVCYRTGRRPRYFYAPMEEYFPKNERKARYSPWGTTPSVMIEKVAIATTHRLQFELTGIYEEQEVANVGANDGSSGPAPLDYGDDPALAIYLADLFAAAEAAKPGSFLPAKIRTELQKHGTAELREKLAKNLAKFIEANGGTVPTRPTPEEMANANLTPDGEEIEEADYEVIDPDVQAETAPEPEPEEAADAADDGEQEALPVD